MTKKLILMRLYKQRTKFGTFLIMYNYKKGTSRDFTMEHLFCNIEGAGRINLT